MDVYIEYALADNVVFHCLILYFTFRVQKIRPKKRNLLFSAVLGAVLGIAVSLLPPSVFVVPLKLFTAVVMLAVVVRYHSFREFLMSGILFVTFTFVFGGGILGLFELFSVDYTSGPFLRYAAEIPLGAIVGGVGAVLFCLNNVIRYIGKMQKRAKLFVSVTVTLENKDYCLRGFVDTGNSLCYAGLPVFVVGEKHLHGIAMEKALRDALTTKKMRMLCYETVGGKKQMPVVVPEKAEVDGKPTNCVLGLPDPGEFRFRNFDVLLHSDCFREEGE